jgi:type I restriction enzyme S subunit
MSWALMTIGDLVDTDLAEIQTGPFGTQLRASDYTSEGTPVINVRNIGYGDLRPEKLEFVPENILEKLSRHIIRENDIVFGRKGAVDRHLFVKEEQSGWMQGSDCIRLRFLSNKICPQFISYAFLQSDHKQWMLTQSSNKSTMASLNQDVIRRIPVLLPDYEIQQKIASILSAYDDLIENNRRRIQLLEQAAWLLYKEWFVSLRFPGHEHVKIVDGVPEGWEKVTLGEKITLNYGKGLKADDRVEGPYPVYGSSGIVGTHEKPLVKGPGIIVGRKGNVGSVFWSFKDYYPIDTVYFIDPETSSYYLYNALQSMQFVSSDAAVPGLNRNFAYSRPYLIPSERLFFLFEETVTPIYEQIFKLEEYDEKLKQARDLLLPRLMNGEIAVTALSEL